MDWACRIHGHTGEWTFPTYSYRDIECRLRYWYTIDTAENDGNEFDVRDLPALRGDLEAGTVAWAQDVLQQALDDGTARFAGLALEYIDNPVSS